MTRLPEPGKDSGQWGHILNDFLSRVHDNDGSIKDGIISEDNLDTATRSKLNTTATGIADGAVTTSKVADSAITNVKLDSTI